MHNYQHRYYIVSAAILFCLAFFSRSLSGQIPNTSWRDHLSYNRAKMIAITPEKVFCSMKSGGMLSYRKDNGELEKMSKVTGLSDINVSSIGYSEEANVLVIGYQNGNIDLLTSSGIINMPDIKNKRLSGLKNINMISIFGTKAYLACNFGIVELDLVKHEVRDSYFFGVGGASIKVNDVAVFNNFIYAATEAGIYKADISSPNLVDYSYWQNVDNLPQNSGEYKLVEVFNNEIFASYRDINSSYDRLIRFTPEANWEYWNPVSDSVIHQLTSYDNNLSLVTDDKGLFYNTDMLNFHAIDMIRGRYAIYASDGNIYTAAEYQGFIIYFGGIESSMKQFNGPRFSTTGYISTKGDHVWVGSGGPFNSFFEGGAYNFHDEKWISLNPGYVDGLDNLGNFYKFAFHPTIENYMYASAYRYGLFELDDYKVVVKHDSSTVPLFREKLNPSVGVRIMGLDFDYKGDLWTVMDEITQPVFVLREGKEWEQLDNLKSSLFRVNMKWRGLIVTKTNQIWFLSDKSGIVVLQEQSDGTIIEKSFLLKNQDGEQLSIAYCMAEDKDGRIWVGTNKGPIYYESSNQIFDDVDVTGTQIKIPRNDGTDLADYLLDYEIVNDIAVDGGNRKWIATETSGVFLVSEDGEKTIQHFNFENSPLISNNVISVGVQENTGEVLISTNQGLVAYMGRATEGLEDFTDVYVYPNPIRPEYEGDITITGLIEDANVKITDISGNLVYETTSLGGQAIWDGKNFEGRRVHTGVYLVFLTNSDGSKTHIAKFVFIN